MTSQDCLVHWSGPIPRSSNTRLVDETAVLPYQKGSMLYDTDASTEDINNSCKADIEAVHAREVFMVRQSPLIPPQAPDVRSSDESGSNISPNALEYDGVSEGQKQARERRNKLKEGRRRRARQRKEAWIKYETELAKYGKKKYDQEVGERRAARARNAPYDKIREVLEELEAISHPNEEQERLRELL